MAVAAVAVAVAVAVVAVVAAVPDDISCWNAEYVRPMMVFKCMLLPAPPPSPMPLMCSAESVCMRVCVGVRA